MMNKTKHLLEIPEMMKNVNVVMIPKPKKTKFAQHRKSTWYFSYKCLQKHVNETITKR